MSYLYIFIFKKNIFHQSTPELLVTLPLLKASHPLVRFLRPRAEALKRLPPVFDRCGLPWSVFWGGFLGFLVGFYCFFWRFRGMFIGFSEIQLLSASFWNVWYLPMPGMRWLLQKQLLLHLELIRFSSRWDPLAWSVWFRFISFRFVWLVLYWFGFVSFRLLWLVGLLIGLVLFGCLFLFAKVVFW